MVIFLQKIVDIKKVSFPAKKGNQSVDDDSYLAARYATPPTSKAF
jgi:hypothetical protein